MRRQAPEQDPLRLGVGWQRADLDKPYVLVESVAGDSHPGSVHLHSLVDQVAAAARDAGGAVARYTCTDMCDGIAQGTDGMDYSLPSRDLIAAVCEMHARSGHYDAVVFVSSCDKAVPAHLMAAVRLDLASIHVPGGAMEAGPGDTTVDQIGSLAAAMRRGELDLDAYRRWVDSVVPTCGACAFMGTALTSQVVAEVLGMALPGTAVMPASGPEIQAAATMAGTTVLEHLRNGLTARDFVTDAAIRNALVVHAAVGGSTNLLLHLPAIAAEADIDFDLQRVREVHDRVPYLLDTRPAGTYPANLFWHAGGVPRVMWELRDHLDLTALAATGRQWGAVLEDWQRAGRMRGQSDTLRARGLTAERIIRPASNPLDPQGAIAVLFGNLAPEGAVAKRSAIAAAARRVVGPARVFDAQEAALDAVTARTIKPGDVVVIRNEGPRGSGMPEQYYVTSAIAADDELHDSVALITDGRFSGASKGPCVGHISPEAWDGGPLALLREGDTVLVDVTAGRVDLLLDGEDDAAVLRGTEELQRRRAAWRRPDTSTERGALAMFRSTATSASRGATMRPPARTIS
jgi:dihydroxy-acid dehydratase